jgi:hypothetical protein
MTTEKLQNLASSSLDGGEKTAVLKLWNSSIPMRKVNKFPLGPFNDSLFNIFLVKYVFWNQLRKAALKLINSFISSPIRTSTPPSVGFTTCIENSRIRQWDYAFNTPIANKEIGKSLEWSKQVHGDLAYSRLIYK